MSSVLVLDDREDDRALLRAVLTHCGHTVIEASDGERALELAAAGSPDLIITDFLMPTMDGQQFIARLRAQGRELTPVLICSAAYLEAEAEAVAAASGAAGVITKPAEPAAIIAAVDRALASPAKPVVPPAALEEHHRRLLSAKLYRKVEELRAAEDERRGLLEQLVHSQEEERRRVANDVHDDSVQAMAAVAMRLDMLAPRLGAEESETVVALAAALREAVVRLRRLIFELRPPELDRGGLSAAISSSLQQSAPAAFEVHLIDSASRHLPEWIAVPLFRIAQEALSNAREHSGASHVRIRVSEDAESVSMVVADDGVGFDTVEVAQLKDRFGLSSMRERAEALGGHAEITSSLGSGTRIEVRLPLPHENSEAAEAALG